MKKLSTLLLAGTALAPAAYGQEIEYWMWDSQQAPIYQQCADIFQTENPDITIKIRQQGWSDYWTALTTGFISNEAPDVFVNHVSRFPEFLVNGVLAELTPMIEADQYDVGGYLDGLAETWKREGIQYGIPKDWDTVAIYYNKEMLADAGLTPEDLQNLTWNPEDGGTYEEVIAKLTVDTNGKRGDEEGFDPNSVQTFGLVTNPISSTGQIDYSYLAASNGFKMVDEQWAMSYNLDDPRLAETLTWFRDLGYEKGLKPTAEQTGRLGGETLLVSEKGAMVLHGSWMLRWFTDNANFDWGVAPVPAGPEGRKSMFNGLADSIWSGSDNQEAAWEWVKFLGSAECQNIVGESGIVFPARPEAIDTAIAKHEAAGVDVSAFTDLAKPETTFPFPMTDYANEIDAIILGAFQRIMLNQGDPEEILSSTNEEVNSLF